MNNRIFIWIIVIVVLAGIGAGIYALSSNVLDNRGSGTDNNAKTFQISAENFKFIMNGEDNPVIRVKNGDRVRIEFTSTGGFHDWRIDEFNAATQQVNTGGSTSVEFTANRKGTFEYYCSVSQHRQNGMKGQLVVE